MFYVDANNQLIEVKAFKEHVSALHGQVDDIISELPVPIIIQASETQVVTTKTPQFGTNSAELVSKFFFNQYDFFS